MEYVFHFRGESRASLPIGAEIIGASRTHFRLWAPKAESVEVVIENNKDPEFFSGEVPVGAGALYRFRVK